MKPLQKPSPDGAADRLRWGLVSTALREISTAAAHYKYVTKLLGGETERGRFELPLPFRADRFSKPT
jgi:hypothetical protein